VAWDHTPLSCPTCGKEVTGKGALGNHMKTHGSGGTTSPGGPPATAAIVTGEAAGVYAEPATAEQRPGGAGTLSTPAPPAPKPSVKDRLLGKVPAGAGGSSLSSASPPRTGERRPAPSKQARVKTADFWGDAIGGVAGLVARTGDLPVARAMDWTSPVAGDIIEDATKDTFLDKMVQPVARNAEKWEDLFDLIGFWAAIAMAEHNPMQAQSAMRFARKRFVSLLPRIHKKIVADRKKEKEAVEALNDLMPDIGDLFEGGVIPPGVDPIDALLQSMFAVPETVNTDQQEEADVPGR
jgi:hypothetical protein